MWSLLDYNAISQSARSDSTSPVEYDSPANTNGENIMASGPGNYVEDIDEDLVASDQGKAQPTVQPTLASTPNTDTFAEDLHCFSRIFADIYDDSLSTLAMNF